MGNHGVEIIPKAGILIEVGCLVIPEIKTAGDRISVDKKTDIVRTLMG
jgi:hypothetical protein